MGQKVSTHDTFFSDPKFLIKSPRELIYYKGMLLVDTSLELLSSTDIRKKQLLTQLTDYLTKSTTWKEMMACIKLWRMSNDKGLLSETEERMKYILSQPPNFEVMCVMEAVVNA